MVRGSGAWIGTNQVRAWREERGRLIKPKEFSSGYWGLPDRKSADGATGILGVAKYPVKNND